MRLSILIGLHLVRTSYHIKPSAVSKPSNLWQQWCMTFHMHNMFVQGDMHAFTKWPFRGNGSPWYDRVMEATRKFLASWQWTELFNLNTMFYFGYWTGVEHAPFFKMKAQRYTLFSGHGINETVYQSCPYNQIKNLLLTLVEHFHIGSIFRHSH